MRTTNKEVKTLIRNHILESYTVEELRTQVDALIGYDRVHNAWQAGVKMVEGGCFLISYYDVNNFLSSLLGSVKLKTDEENWDRYKHLIGREVEYLVK